MGDALNGLSVSGSFTYDSDGLIGTPSLGGATVYQGPFTSLTATVGSFAIADTGGEAHVMNDGYLPIRPPQIPQALEAGDLFMLAANSLSAPSADLVGFDIATLIGTLPLFNLRMFWIETLPLSDGNSLMASAAPIPDFLTSADLPATLPGFGGRLALDFQTPAGQQGCRRSCPSFSTIWS